MRTVRRSVRPVALRIRIASIITAEPAALSVAPVPVCHESKWAPSITSSSALSVPRISPITLNAPASPWGKLLRISISSATGIFLARMRTMRL